MLEIIKLGIILYVAWFVLLRKGKEPEAVRGATFGPSRSKNTLYGFPVTISNKLPCTCTQLPEHPTSMDYSARYEAMLKCPRHRKVLDVETKKYEPTKGSIKWQAYKRQKGYAYMDGFVVAQAVWKGRDGQVGIKQFDTQAGYRAIASFRLLDDARAYLLAVLDTVKREQKSGHRTKQNLDPNYEGGLDFCIVPAAIVFPHEPLLARGWQLSPKPKVDDRRKPTHDRKHRGRGESSRANHTRRRVTRDKRAGSHPSTL